MLDVIVVGAGPAGAVAATILARAGARVQLLDRARFPRDKLCGDTLNPGTLAILRRLGLADRVEREGLRIDGMIVTGGNGVSVDARYPRGLHGRALVRRDLDLFLVEQAVAAGAAFEPCTAVGRAAVDAEGRVRGVVLQRAPGGSGAVTIDAPVVVAADGRHSTLAFGLGLARHPDRPRRWAFGAYVEGAQGVTTCGEMHVRRDGYIGVAPVPGGLTNVCVVKALAPGSRVEAPEALVRAALARDRLLADRFAAARLVAPPAVLGPLAVDAVPRAIDGLLVAGDAAGFVDPMTGDGLRFAVGGGELAAAAALEALERGWSGVHARLARARAREFDGKRRFNRALRALVASPAAVGAGSVLGRLAPSAVGALVRYAGDCPLAR